MPQVCQYEMQAVPGHSVVSHKVEFRWLHKASFQQKQLAEATAKPGRKRSRWVGVCLEVSRLTAETFVVCCSWVICSLLQPVTAAASAMAMDDLCDTGS